MDWAGYSAVGNYSKIYNESGTLPAYDMDFMADYMHDLFEELGVDNTGTVLIGHSDGSLAAIEYAIQYPTEIGRIVIAGSPAFGKETVEGIDSGDPISSKSRIWPISRALYPQFAKTGLIPNAVQYLCWSSKSYSYFSGFGLGQGSEDKYKPIASMINKAFNQYSKSLQADPKYLKKMDVPLALLQGEQDLVTPVSMAIRFMNVLPKEDIGLFLLSPMAGHEPLEVDIPELMGHLKAFINDESKVVSKKLEILKVDLPTSDPSNIPVQKSKA